MKRRIDPTLLAVVGEGFFSRLSFGLISFAFPLYAYRMGMSIQMIGLVASANMIVAVVLKPFMGGLADRFGRKPTLAIAIMLRSLVSLLLAVATVPWQLFATRGVHGVSIAMRDPAVHALIAEHGGKKAIASSFAWYQTAKSVAGTIGKTLAGVLLAATASDFSIVFGVAYALSIIPVLLVMFFVRGGRPAHEPVVEAQPAQSAPAGTAPAPEAKRPPVLRFSLLGFLISGSAYMLANLFPIIATEYGHLTEAQAGLIYSLSALPALMGPVFGWLSDHVSQKFVLSLRSIGNVFSSLVYLVAPGFAGMATGRMMDDLGKAAFRPAWGAVMASVSDFDPRHRARTMGAISAAEDAGEIAGPIVAGLLWSTWGIPVLLIVRVFAALGTEAYTIALTGSIRRLAKRSGERSAEVSAPSDPEALPVPSDITRPIPAIDVTQHMPAFEAITQPIPAIVTVEETAPVPASAPRDEVPVVGQSSSTSSAASFAWAIEWRSEGGVLQPSS